jgi:hypothetical protein
MAMARLLDRDLHCTGYVLLGMTVASVKKGAAALWRNS